MAFKLNDPAEIAWLISTVYLAAEKDDKEEGFAVFRALMKEFADGI
jgi:hypothetical protein